MNSLLVRQVWRRANGRCEYCGISFPEYAPPFQIDHVLARQHGGTDDIGNLALSCLHCNRHKGPNIAGRDPKTGDLVPLFHPRTDSWSDHFHLNGTTLVGLTAVGRVTIQVLAMNDPEFMAVREVLLREGIYRVRT